MIFQSVTQAAWKKKSETEVRIGLEPMTFWLLVLMPYRNATGVSAFKFEILKTIYHVIIIGLRRRSAPGGLHLHFLGESFYM